MLNLAVDPAALTSLIETVVTSVVTKLQDERSEVLAYSEEDAAQMLGLQRHQLRDERLRGRIAASKIVGGKIRYQRAELLAYLARNRTT